MYMHTMFIGLEGVTGKEGGAFIEFALSNLENFTVWPGTGAWQGVLEEAVILQFVSTREEIPMKLRAVAEYGKEVLHQSVVLITTHPVETEYI